jgi:hypothetical protein
MGQTALIPLRRKACCGFFRPKNPTASAGFEPTAQRGVEVYIYSFFNLSARWGGWSTPRLGCFTPGKHPVPIVGPRAGLDGCGNLASHRHSMPGPSSSKLCRLRSPGPSKWCNVTWNSLAQGIYLVKGEVLRIICHEGTEEECLISWLIRWTGTNMFIQVD